MENQDSRNVPDLIALTVIEEQPRARDLDIAERLGFQRPRAIRQVIERNRIELEGFGSLATQHGKSRGQEFIEFHLNEEQALLIATLSDAPKAPEVRSALIRTFVAYRRGQIGPAVDYNKIGRHVAAITQEKLAVLIPTLVKAEILNQQFEVVNGVTAGGALDMAGIKVRKGLRGLARYASNRLMRYHAERRVAVKMGTLGSRTAYVFEPEIVKDWLKSGGKAELDKHVAERRGQGVLKLVPAATKDGEGTANV